MAHTVRLASSGAIRFFFFLARISFQFLDPTGTAVTDDNNMWSGNENGPDDPIQVTLSGPLGMFFY